LRGAFTGWRGRGRGNGKEKLLCIEFGNLGLFKRVSYVGVCRKWSDSNTTCDRTFPPNLDITQVILQDIRLNSNISLPANTTSDTNESFPSLSKAASALIITSLIWCFLIFGLIQIMPTEFYVQILPLLAFVSLSISAWVIYNYIFYNQVRVYNSGLAVSSAGNTAVVGGPGFWVFLVYLICTLVITPVTSFWLLMIILFLIICFLIFVWLCFLCCMALLAFAGTGETETERRRRLGLEP
jgi:hypothetical protein